MSTVFATFGIWDVTEDGIIANSENVKEYQVTGIFRTRMEEGVRV